MVAEEAMEARSKGKPYDLVVFTKRGVGSYVTGGFTVDCGFFRKVLEVGAIQAAASAGYTAEVPESSISGQACKCLLRVTSTGAEVASTTNVSAVLVRFIAKGY